MKRLMTIAFAATALFSTASHAIPPIIQDHHVLDSEVAWSNECDWMNPKPAHCFPLQQSSSGIHDFQSYSGLNAVPARATSTTFYETISTLPSACDLGIGSSGWNTVALDPQQYVPDHVHFRSVCNVPSAVAVDKDFGRYLHQHEAATARQIVNHLPPAQGHVPHDTHLPSPSYHDAPALTQFSEDRTDFEMTAHGYAANRHVNQAVKSVLDQQPLVQKRTSDGNLVWDFMPGH